MRIFGRRRVAVLAIMMLATMGTAQPVAAYKDLKHTGTVGYHSLLDTAAQPAADCRYEYVGDQTYELDQIIVWPPNVRAVPGQGVQQVGFNFTVQRQTFYFPDQLGPWQNRYTSRVFKANTNSSNLANLPSGSVDVVVPDRPGESYTYRVLIKVFWYRANGSVMGTALMRPQRYATDSTGPTANQNNYCWDLQFED